MMPNSRLRNFRNTRTSSRPDGSRYTRYQGRLTLDGGFQPGEALIDCLTMRRQQEASPYLPY